MKFAYIIYYVENVPQTLNFYEKAFGIIRLFLHESHQYAEMDTGSTTLAFASFEMAKFNELELYQFTNPKKLPSVELAFVAENVEESFARAISEGAVEIKKPTMKPWGQMVGYVQDCNGYLVEICSSMK